MASNRLNNEYLISLLSSARDQEELYSNVSLTMSEFSKKEVKVCEIGIIHRKVQWVTQDQLVKKVVWSSRN